MSNGARETRPFDFMTLFWGERYRNYFVNLCLPSLLSVNNLTVLRANDGHRFLIATTDEDREAIERLPILDRLRRHAAPEWIRIETPPVSPPEDAFAQYAANIRHMGNCQRRLVEAAYARQGYGCLLWPDVLISDGMVGSMLKFARAGHRLVLCSALRQVEEAVLGDLAWRGLLPASLSLAKTGEALTIPPRLAAELAIRHLHPEMTALEEGAPGQPANPPFRYWRMPEGRGILLHTFYAVPVLMDYAVVKPDHTACLDREQFENVYVSSTFAECGHRHIVADSDEFCMLSLTPGAVNYAAASPATLTRPRLFRRLRQLRSIRQAMEVYVRRNQDVVRRDLFAASIRWHVRDLDQIWIKEEQRIRRTIDDAVGDYYGVGGLLNRNGLAHRISARLRYLLLDLPWHDLPLHTRRILRLPAAMLRKIRQAAQSMATSTER
jgi:hypothetical protein